ncbi:uncharacterized protein [Dermacentor albipictus]|uniref:uncharacterized protein n=1 Tax=Dermacentor albipictus TaxID=60249 RepID=UPI0031FC6B2C
MAKRCRHCRLGTQRSPGRPEEQARPDGVVGRPAMEPRNQPANTGLLQPAGAANGIDDPGDIPCWAAVPLQQGSVVSDVLQDLRYWGLQRRLEERSQGGRRGDPAPIDQDAHYGLQDGLLGVMVTSYGTVTILLRHSVCVDISADRAIRLVNMNGNYTAAMSWSGARRCVCHPCGRVLQQGSNVDLAIGSRLGKISYRGVTFSAFNHGLVYLVDEAGTKSTTERFHNLCYDVALHVFYPESEPDMETMEQCFDMASKAVEIAAPNGDRIWFVDDVRIRQTPWGDVQVTRETDSAMIWTSPSAGTVSVTGPCFKTIVSPDPTQFLSVRMGHKKLVASAQGLTVRNGSQRAGLDYLGRLFLPR